MLIQEHIYSPFPRLMTRFALSRGLHRCCSLILERQVLFSRTYIYMVHMYIHTYGARYIILLTSSAQGLGRAFAVRLLEAGAK